MSGGYDACLSESAEAHPDAIIDDGATEFAESGSRSPERRAELTINVFGAVRDYEQDTR